MVEVRRALALLYKHKGERDETILLKRDLAGVKASVKSSNEGCGGLLPEGQEKRSYCAMRRRRRGEIWD